MKHISYIILITVLFVTGCSKDLDLYPLDSVSDAIFWKKAPDYQLAANSLYLSLSSHNFWGDSESDIAFNFGNEISNGTYVVTETDNKWSSPYVYIRRSNKIISMAGKENLMNDPEVARFVAEAKFFRAWNYWMLFRLYGGVPLIMEVPDIDSEILYAPRSTRKETVDFILQDLAESALLLPEKSGLKSAETGRITKGAAMALRARVALFEGTWLKYHGVGGGSVYFDIAIESAGSVMNSNQFSLYNGKGIDSYRYLFIEEGDNSPENILDDRFEVNIRDHDFPGDILAGKYLGTKKLVDMYLCNDGLPINKSQLFQGYNGWDSEFENRDPRMKMTFLIPGSQAVWELFPDPIASWPFFPQRNGNTGYITNKYRSENRLSNISQQARCGYDIRIIRYAEVLLTYAEALFEKNGNISNADLNKTINIIRARVNMLPLTNEFVAANNLDMKNEIRRERTVELAFEGYRYDDLRRWKTAEVDLREAIKGIKIVGTRWGSDPIVINGDDKNVYRKLEYQTRTDENGFLIAEPSSARRFEPGKHYLRPLPTKEIMINDKLKQNPGW